MTAPKQFVRLTSGDVSTTPVGYMNTTYATGTTTCFGLMLDDTSATPNGLRAAPIESFTANTIANSAGVWSGNLANPATPWAVRLTSGAAAGKIFDITANTATTLTLSGPALTTLAVAVGDTFELVSLDTLSTLYGATPCKEALPPRPPTSYNCAAVATWIAFYYDTALGFWRRTSGTASNSNDTIIRPGSGVLLLRRGPTLTLTLTGRVLGTAFRASVNNASTTGLTAGYPMDTTLAGFGLQNLLSGWRAARLRALPIRLVCITAHLGAVSLQRHLWQTTTGVNSDTIVIQPAPPS